MMRYQRVIPDLNPLSNGSKSSFRCKEDGENGSKAILSNGGGFRFRSPSKPLPPPPPPSQENNNHYNHSNNNNNTTTSASSPLSDNNNNNHNSNGDGNGNDSRGGDVLLQWGHKKRSRLSRTEIRSLTDDSSSSSSIHRRGGSSFVDKPPPALPLPHSHSPITTSTSTRASNLRTKESSGFMTNRNIEDRSGGANGSPSRNLAGGNSRGVTRSPASKGSPHSSEKIDKKARKEEKRTNGSLARSDAVSTRVQSEQQAQAERLVAAAAKTTTKANAVVSVAAEKVKVEVIEWPKIYIALSRKEKEDDFLAMKGTKLPHRPKKRAKNIDRTLQYCFPGMWLSDLTKSRYEVREKKIVKKKKQRRGLKAMESMETDSE